MVRNELHLIKSLLPIWKKYADGFVFYASENEGFASAMKVKNYTMASFILSELASKYLELQGFK
jgi:hypothetical protein